MSLAFEYLINTVSLEVSLQLRLKAVKLLNAQKASEHIFQTINRFNGYRSKVVHGSGEVSNDKKTATVVNDAERIILDILLRMIELNQTFTFNQISEDLNKSLYLPQTLYEILNKKAD